MKIEKVNDHQIRCTLTKSDLADRELKISELAYGTEKAKNLFRDMMQQASFEFGFEAEDIPLMIEAIPLNSDCIVLIITKVEDPEELDTRFSKFAPSVHDTDSAEDTTSLLAGGADDVLDLFKKIHDSSRKAKENEGAPKQIIKEEPVAAEEAVEVTADVDITRIFSFDSILGIAKLAHILNHFYDGANSLYKNTNTNKYMLVVSKSSHSPAEFNKVCNILSEYGDSEKYVRASEAYLEEHFAPIIKDRAIQSLELV